MLQQVSNYKIIILACIEGKHARFLNSKHRIENILNQVYSQFDAYCLGMDTLHIYLHLMHVKRYLYSPIGRLFDGFTPHKSEWIEFIYVMWIHRNTWRSMNLNTFLYCIVDDHRFKDVFVYFFYIIKVGSQKYLRNCSMQNFERMYEPDKQGVCYEMLTFI